MVVKDYILICSFNLIGLKKVIAKISPSLELERSLSDKFPHAWKSVSYLSWKFSVRVKHFDGFIFKDLAW